MIRSCASMAGTTPLFRHPKSAARGPPFAPQRCLHLIGLHHTTSLLASRNTPCTLPCSCPVVVVEIDLDVPRALLPSRIGFVKTDLPQPGRSMSTPRSCMTLDMACLKVEEASPIRPTGPVPPVQQTSKLPTTHFQPCPGVYIFFLPRQEQFSVS